MDGLRLAALAYSISPVYGSSLEPFWAVTWSTGLLSLVSYLYLFSTSQSTAVPSTLLFSRLLIVLFAAAEVLLSAWALWKLDALRVIVLLLLDPFLSLVVSTLFSKNPENRDPSRWINRYSCLSVLSVGCVVLFWYSGSGEFLSISTDGIVCGCAARLVHVTRLHVSNLVSGPNTNVATTVRNALLLEWIGLAPAAWFARYFQQEPIPVDLNYDVYVSVGVLFLLFVIRPPLDAVFSRNKWLRTVSLQFELAGGFFFCVGVMGLTVTWFQYLALVVGLFIYGILGFISYRASVSVAKKNDDDRDEENETRSGAKGSIAEKSGQTRAAAKGQVPKSLFAIPVQHSSSNRKLDGLSSSPRTPRASLERSGSATSITRASVDASSSSPRAKTPTAVQSLGDSQAEAVKPTRLPPLKTPSSSTRFDRSPPKTPTKSPTKINPLAATPSRTPYPKSNGNSHSFSEPTPAAVTPSAASRTRPVSVPNRRSADNDDDEDDEVEQGVSFDFSSMKD
eukprot:ANDGO_06090.mRNA.1 hypothetical protein